MVSAAPEGTVSRVLGAPRGELLLAALAAALAVGWTTPPGPLGGSGRVLALAFAAAFALALRRRSAAAAAALVALALAADELVPRLPVSYEARLRVEAVAALFPLAAMAAALVAARRADLRTPARPLVWLALVLAAVGSLARIGEVMILRERPGDASTILYVLRYDLAYAFWGAAAVAIAVAFAVSGLARRDARARRRRAALGAAILVFMFLAADGFALVASSASPRPELVIGYHARSVSGIPAGAQLVHLEAAWPSIERAEGVMRWDRLDRQLDEAARLDVPVYLLVNTYPPAWMSAKHPDAVMVDQHGEPFMWIDEEPGRPRDRVWDLSFASTEVVAAKRAFLAAVLDRVGDHPAVAYVAVQNEPTYPLDWNLLRWASFDRHTVEGFREVVRDEAGGHLFWVNARYGTAFESWDDVVPPPLPLGPFGDRWVRYREDLLVAFVGELVTEAKSRTDRPVTVKMMAHFLTRFAEPQSGLGDRAFRAMADMSDVVSVDLYPVTKADLVRSLRYFEDIAAGKPLIIAEFNLALGSSGPFAGARMLSALRIIEEHADAVILFTTTRHYLYGMEPDSATAQGVRIFALRPGDPGYGDAVVALVASDARTLVSAPTNAARSIALAVWGA